MIILRDILIGLLFGYSAAILIGPINVEMLRRNVRNGTGAGLCFGLGAGFANIIYLILLSMSAISILNHPILCVISLLGALALG